MKIITIFILSSLLISCTGGAKKKLAVEAPLPKTQTVTGKELTLQGQGFRVIGRMQIYVKVYKAGLYTEKKFTSAKNIIDSQSPKKIYMRFTYTVSRLKLVDGWKSAYKKNCNTTCEETQKPFNKFLEASTAMNLGEVMEIDFTNNGVTLIINKEKTQVTNIKSSALSKNLLSIFIGEKAVDKKLKKSLVNTL